MLEIVRFLEECKAQWEESQTLRLFVVVVDDTEAQTEVTDRATLRQAVLRLALAQRSRSNPGGDVRIKVSRTGPPSSDAHLGSDWVGLTFSADAVAGGQGSEGHSEDYWNELTRVSVLVRALGGRLISPQTEGPDGPLVLYLPAAHQGAADVRAGDPSKQAPHVRILLLEDNPETRWAVAEILNRMQYEVIEAESPEDVRRLTDAPEGGVQLIVGEPVLGLREGVSLLLEASARCGGAPVLLMTGRRLDPETQAWLKAMGLHWLQKPFSRDELLRKVGETLRPSP